MINKNYKDESFIKTGPALIYKLENIAFELQQNMKDSKSRFIASEILNTGKNAFHRLWPDVKPNNPYHKYSKNDFKGLYAFAIIKNGKINWQYIGVSQTIKRRFKGHTLRKTKNSATWAYLMCKSEENIHIKQKEIIHPCYFTFVKIDSNMLLHMAEVYCVNKFKSTWNSFETH